MSNSFTSVFGPAGGGTDATKLPLAGGTLTGAMTLPNAILSGLSLTSAQATNTIDVSTTWNTSENPTLIYARATNTASGATSKLMSLGTAAGGELFSGSKTGGFVAVGTAQIGNYLFFQDGIFYPTSSTAIGNSALGFSSLNLASSGHATGITSLLSAGAAQFQMGSNATSGTPVLQTLKGPNGTAGQTNQAGGTLTLSSGLSTGSGAASVILATSGNVAASTTLNSAVTRLTANASGIAIGANGTASATIKHGTATLTAGTVTVSDADTLTTSRIFINRQTDGGTIGDSYSITRSAGTSFTITSKTANATVTGDTSTVSYLIINP